MMNQPRSGDGFEVIRSDDAPGEAHGSVLIKSDPDGFVDYVMGVKLETADGPVVEIETGSMEMISAIGTPEGQRLGTRLFARMIEEARQDSLRYIRMSSIIDPRLVSIIERALKEGRIEDRAYRLWDDGPDMASESLLQAKAATAAEAANRVRDADGTSEIPVVQCVVQL